MNGDDINDYLPSILNPRTVRKQNGDLSLTQSFNYGLRFLLKWKMNGDDINDYLPSILNPRTVRKQNGDLSLTQNSFVSRSSLSLRRNNVLKLKSKPKILVPSSINKENSQNVQNLISNTTINTKKIPKIKCAVDRDSLGFSAIEDLQSVANNFDSCSLSLVDAVPARTKLADKSTPLVSVSSHTELDQNVDSKSETTVIYVSDRPTISVTFGIDNCQSVDINSKNSAIKRVLFSHDNNNTVVDCEIIEGSTASTESDLDENMNELFTPNSLKRSAVTVNLEIKKKKPSSTETAENKVLILNTSAIEKISHVIVQPPNYKLVKGKILDKSKFKSGSKRNSVLGLNVNNGKVRDRLKQKSIDSFFPKRTNVLNLKVSEGRSLADQVSDVEARVNKNGDEEVMSRNSGVADAIKSDRSRKSPYKGSRLDNEASNRSTRIPSPRKDDSRLESGPELKTSCSSPRGKADSPSSHSPKKAVESIHFSVPPKSVSTKRSVSSRNIPHHKIVAGTHFAVDAFSYGEIPNVKHYFLTHFHSDHYSGLKKSFNKLLFCSKITADLCISRLGVSPKCIHMIKIDETIRIEDVEVTAVEANHCPGAIMLVFTLPNGKTLLHTGDFRASPVMESYPIFWNKDIHTIYLDTTYCNPRYDFPTQEQSLEMALYILRQKKVALEKVGKKFSSVLIVCGTYTIGKEKFFLGMSRRVGCTVWACPEKDRVLQAVEGRSFGHAPPHSCQLHVVPMRDLTHEKLRSYLDSLKGAFTEIVAFKPSGWENGKSTSVERDMVTIHGIPYSEHSSFSELIRFVKFLKPKQVVPTVDISGGVRAVQKYFPCPLVHKEEIQCQSKVTDFFSIQNQPQVPAVT